MDAAFETKNLKYLASRHQDMSTSNDVLEYLKMEFHEMILYASKDVIFSVKSFIEKPTYEKFLETILIMRKDLSPTGKVEFSLESIKLTLVGKI